MLGELGRHEPATQRPALDSCRKTVTDLTGMTEREAERWARADERACVRMRVDEDGQPLFARRRRETNTRLAAMMTAATLASCSAPPLESTAEQDAAPTRAPLNVDFTPGFLGQRPHPGTPATKPSLSLPVLQIADLPRDDEAARCDPHVAPERHVMGNMAGPARREVFAHLVFTVDRARSVALDGEPLTRAQLAKGATRVTPGAHTLTYTLDGVPQKRIVAFGRDERATVRLP